MAVRNQPYMPLYVQDFLTDEKLAECSATATGVYIRLMCLMHKSQEYGIILLKQKDKQSENQIENFAHKVAKYFPYDFATVYNSLAELVDEGVIKIDGDRLFQKRMVKDAKLSDTRASVGRKGGKNSSKNKELFAQAKTEANAEIVNENEIIVEAEDIGGTGEKGKFKIDPKMEIPVNVLELAEMNQWTLTNERNTEFIKKQWKTFLHERSHDPPGKKMQYHRISDITSYFLNWVRNKHPNNGAHKQTSSGNNTKQGTSEARINTAKNW